MAYITYCSMTQNRLSETVACLKRYLPYVDHAVIVDGGSIDDTIITLRNWSEEEPKLEFYLHPWMDNFSEQRNNYLKHVKNDTWALVSDPDEVFEEDTLKAMRDLIKEAEIKNKDMIGFQCRSVSYKGPNRVWENLDNYHKRLLFKKYDKTKYKGNPHESITGHPLNMMNTSFVYEHIKQENVIWHRGARNLFVGGGGPNLGKRNHRWIDLRKICSSISIETWHDFDKYLVTGNIDPRIKDWMNKYKSLEGFDGASEHREMWKLYFETYHPEEQS